MFKFSWDVLKQKNLDEIFLIFLMFWKFFWFIVVVNVMFVFVNVVISYVGLFFINDFVEYLSGRWRFEYEGLILVLIFLFVKVIENMM